MKKINGALLAIIFMLTATNSFADYSYTIRASNNGDADGPAIPGNVTVYLASTGADCNATPSACDVTVGTIAQGVSPQIFTPTSVNATVSVWIYDATQNSYYLCTPSVCPDTADNITAHQGGCLGQTD